MSHYINELGLDYAWSHPSISAMKAQGYRFAMRYLSWLPNGKVINSTEYHALRAADIAVGANWEYNTSDQLRGTSGGRTDAAEAKRQMRALGMPAGTVCYFSADWDVSSGQIGTCAAYWAAAKAVLAPEYHVGVYSGKRAVSAALDRGFWGWQTYAWSYGSWDARAHIRQVQNGINVGGADCDKNQLKRLDAGLVGLGAPTPTPTPTPIVPKEDTMFVKVKGNAATFVSDGFKYRPMHDAKALGKAVQAGYKVLEFDSLAQMEDAAGKPA